MEYKNIRINGKTYKIFSDDGIYWFLTDRKNEIRLYAGLTIDEWTDRAYLDSISPIRIDKTEEV